MNLRCFEGYVKEMIDKVEEGNKKVYLLTSVHIYKRYFR